MTPERLQRRDYRLLNLYMKPDDDYFFVEDLLFRPFNGDGQEEEE